MRRLFIQLNTVLFFLPFHHNLFFLLTINAFPLRFHFNWLLCTFLGIFSSLESFLFTTRLWICLATSLPGPEANYLPNFRLWLNISNSHLIYNNEAPSMLVYLDFHPTCRKLLRTPKSQNTGTGGGINNSLQTTTASSFFELLLACDITRNYDRIM